MKKKKWIIFLFCALITAVAGAQGVSWSINISPRNRKVCKGDTINFSLENEQFIVPGLKNGEYVERISTSYRWKKNEATGYTNGDSFSIETGGNNGQGVGTFGVTVEGRAEYNIVWTDADTGVINRDGPHSVGWLALDSTNYTVVETEYNWPSTSSSITVTTEIASLPNQLFAYLNNKIGNKLRGMRISIDNVSITCSKKERNCCDSGVVIVNGDSEIQGALSAGFSIQGRIIEAVAAGCGVPIQTNDDYTITIPYISTEITVEYNVDITINSSSSISGSLGKKQVLCEPQKECLFGGFGVSTNLVPQLIIQATLCIRHGSNINCSEITIVPVSCSIGFNMSVNYNTECDNKWHGSCSIGSCTLSSQITFGPYTYQHDYDIWDGFPLINF